MKNLTFLITLILVAISVTVNAQFTGDFDPAHWEAQDSQGGTIYPSTDELVLSGSVGSGDLQYTITTASDFAIGFSWQYSTTDESPRWDPAFYVIDGVEHQLTFNAGPLNQSGSVGSISVPAGSTFGFLQRSDGCCGEGTLTISEFVFENQDAQEVVEGGGASCQLAFPVVENTEYHSPVLANGVWYKFTTPDAPNQKIVLNVEAYTSVQVYRQPCFSGGPINYGYTEATNGTVVVGDFLPNDNLIFVLYDYGPESDLTMSFSVEDAGPGESCNNAIPATEGQNTLAVNANSGDIWFSYTMPVSGSKVVLTSSASESITIYEGTCGALLYSMAGYSDLEVTAPEPGQQFFIRWSTNFSNQDLTWTLSEQDLAEGDVCSDPIPALTGLNSTPTDGGDVWFSYTMPPDPNKKLMITSASFGNVTVFEASCENPIYLGYGYPDLEIPTLLPNQEILIRWNTSSPYTLTWNIAIGDLVPGEVCSLPVDMVLGSNVVPATELDAYWYSFTMPAGAPKKLVITSASQSGVFFYSGTCDQRVIEGSFYGNGEITNFNPGDQGFFSWQTYEGGDFSFNVSFEDLQPGESCYSAIPIDVSLSATDITTPSSNQDTWYSFTMPVNKKLIVTSNNSTYVEVYTGQCGNLNDQGYGYQGLTTTSIAGGQTVFIQWPGASGFDWNISFEDQQQGEGCSSAPTANVGANQLVSNGLDSYWYRFTMPDGPAKKLVVTSADTYIVNLYRGACGEVEQYDFGYGNLISPDLLPGETIFINWLVFPQTTFDWEIALQDLVPGDNCQITIPASEGTNDTTLPPQWFSFTMPGSGDITISSAGQTDTDTFLKVFSVCGGDLLAQSDDEVDYQSRVTLSNVPQGTVLKILWDDRYSAEPFQWTLVLENLVYGQSQTITFNAIEPKFFGDPNFDLQASSDAGLPVSYANDNPAVATISGTTVTIVGVGTTNITASQSGNASFVAATPVIRTLIVNKGNQTITFSPIESKILDDLPFTISASTSSGLPVSFQSSDPSIASVNGNVITINNAGATTITATQPGNVNYNAASPIERILTIKRNQSINFPVIHGKTIGDAPFEISATATSGLTVSFHSADPSIASISGTTVTLHKSGTVNIIANQTGNDFYKAAPSVERSLTISKRSQLLTFGPLTSRTIGDLSFNLDASSSASLPVSFQVSNETLAQVSGSMVTMLAPGAVTITAVQPGNDEYLPAVPVEQTFCINPLAPQIVADFDNPEMPVLNATSLHENQWYRNGLPIDGANGNSYIVTSAGEFQVGTKVGSCTSALSESFAVLITATGLESQRVAAYPNPVKNELFIHGIQERDVVTIFSSLGIQAKPESKWFSTEKMRMILVGNLPTGVYTLAISEKNGIRMLKFVKD